MFKKTYNEPKYSMILWIIFILLIFTANIYCQNDGCLVNLVDRTPGREEVRWKKLDVIEGKDNTSRILFIRQPIEIFEERRKKYDLCK